MTSVNVGCQYDSQQEKVRHHLYICVRAGIVRADMCETFVVLSSKTPFSAQVSFFATRKPSWTESCEKKIFVRCCVSDDEKFDLDWNRISDEEDIPHEHGRKQHDSWGRHRWHRPLKPLPPIFVFGKMTSVRGYAVVSSLILLPDHVQCVILSNRLKKCCVHSNVMLSYKMIRENIGQVFSWWLTLYKLQAQYSNVEL